MPNNWKTYKLGELAKLRKNNIAPKDFDNQHYIGLEHIGQGTFLLDGIGTASDATSNKSIFKSGDILYGKIRPYFKKVYRPKFSGICSTDILVINSKDEELITQSYLQQIIKTQDFSDKATETSSGTKMPRADWNSLEKLEYDLPSLPEQKSIAQILSTIDDKIENNLAINKTLEEMAMALYKHWFVDFGPFQSGEFVVSELGSIPKGWEVKKLVDFVKLTMGQSPKSEFYNSNNEGLPFHQGVTNYGERFPEDKTYSTEGNRFAEEGDILFSVRAPVGRLNIAKNKIILGRGLSSMSLKKFTNNGFLFYSLKNFFTEDDKIGDGTVYGSVNKTELENLKFIVPCNETLENFNDLVKDIDSKYLNNYKENQALTQLRDTLLPKLISGEVRLKEFRETITN
jgi:type I restriction enzyme S subunit